MSEMAQRIAQVLWDHARGNDGGLAWNALPKEYRGLMLAAARMAIEAMREPTPKMLALKTSDGARQIGELNLSAEALQNLRIWQAMIDAELAPDTAHNHA